MIRPIFYTTSASKQLLILLFVLMASFILFAIVSSVGMIAFPKNLDNNTYPIEYTQYLLFVQGLTIMIIPSLVFTFLTNLRPLHSIGVQPIKPLWWIVLSMVVITSIQPLAEYLGVLNNQMVLPSFLSGVELWMRESETAAATITAEILQGMHLKNILANVFIVAIIPAIGEELIFRGCFQKVLGQWWKNPHLAILVTAFLFSAIHFQFYGFLPRFVLGVVLGYLFYWSKNIWVSVIAHFLNNFMALMLYYYYVTYGGIDNPLNVPSDFNRPVWIILSGTLIFGIAAYLSYRLYKRTKRLAIVS